MLLVSWRTRRPFFVTVVALLVTLTVGLSQASAGTTLDSTVVLDRSKQVSTSKAGAAPYRPVRKAEGEPYMTRRLNGVEVDPQRSKRRTSITYFGQITDPHIADEMSPARIELTDGVGDPLTDVWRPQEAMTLQDLASLIRNINTETKSPVSGKNGSHAKMGFVITTGDLADNQQLNEAKWFIKEMDGGQLDPYSGKPISDSNPCPGIDDAEKTRLNTAVAQRRYMGIQNFDDFPNVPADRYLSYWDPNRPMQTGMYANFPTYAGLMDRAQKPFTSPGVKVPWYISRGNHDGLLKGVLTTSSLIKTFVKGCLKIFPSEGFDPHALGKLTIAKGKGLLENADFLKKLFTGLRHIAPDPERRFISEKEYKKVAGSGAAHGFGLVDKAENKASNGNAAYYAWSPKPSLRFISMDTVSEGGGDGGNLDDSQYKWLARELDKNSSVSYSPSGKIVHDGDPNRLIVLYGHHPLETMDNNTPDEASGVCDAPLEPGCDADPRSSKPLHFGNKGKQDVRDLLLKYPNVVAYVNGHRHENHLDPVTRPDKRSGFWNINTASHISFPQQARLVDLNDNHDGTLSFFATVIENSSGVVPPAPTTSAAKVASFTDSDLASISRQLSANDPQWDGEKARGKLKDRNAELVIRDPRLLAKK